MSPSKFNGGATLLGEFAYQRPGVYAAGWLVRAICAELCGLN